MYLKEAPNEVESLPVPVSEMSSKGLLDEIQNITEHIEELYRELLPLLFECTIRKLDCSEYIQRAFMRTGRVGRNGKQARLVEADD